MSRNVTVLWSDSGWTRPASNHGIRIPLKTGRYGQGFRITAIRAQGHGQAIAPVREVIARVGERFNGGTTVAVRYQLVRIPQDCTVGFGQIIQVVLINIKGGVYGEGFRIGCIVRDIMRRR